jgi:hypothetical protein
MNPQTLLEAITALPLEGQRLAITFTMFLQYYYDYERKPPAGMLALDVDRDYIIDFFYFMEYFRKYYCDVLHPYDATTHSTEKPGMGLGDEDFIGMWQDRVDLKDSQAWVRQHRQSEWNS